MATLARPVALSVTAMLALGSLAPAAAAKPCSTDVFTIEGNSLHVELCVQAGVNRGQTSGVTLAETFSLNGRPPYSRDVPLEVVGGVESSRTIDDVSLGKLGIAKTLHLTIVYKGGSVRLEHALLVPGALTLK